MLPFRRLLKTPGFAAVSILTLALGIAASTALFSLFNELILHPHRFPAPDTLVRIWTNNAAKNLVAPAISWPKFQHFRDQQASFAQVALSTGANFSFARDDAEPEQLFGLRVSANFLSTLGVQPALGRTFTAEEDSPGGADVAIISHEFWQTRLGGRTGVLGQTILLEGAPHVIVGVLPPAVSNPFNNVLILAPRAFEPQGLTADQMRVGSSVLQVTARLKPDASLAAANTEISGLSKRYGAAFPDMLDAQNENDVRLFTEELAGSLRPTFYLLIGVVAAVLLIACANVSNLFLARLSARQKEVAIRVSLGATRWQLVSQFLFESLATTALAALVGIGLAAVALRAVQTLASAQLPPNTVFSIDLATLGFTALVCGVCAVCIGLVPALQSSRANLSDILKDSTRGAPGGVRGSRFRSALIVADVALSVVLLIAAGLLLVSFFRLQRTPAGFRTEGVAAAFVSLPLQRYPTSAQQAEFYVNVLEQLRANPQVRGAAAALGLPLSGFLPIAPYVVDGGVIPPLPERPLAGFRVVSDGYLPTMGIALREGRAIGAQDREGAPNVCMLSESFAKRLFPGGSALGKSMRRGREAEMLCEVVGIVADVKSNGVGAPPPDEIYYSMRQLGRPGLNLVAQIDGDPTTLQSIMRRAVANVDRAQPISFFQTLDVLAAQALGFQRIVAWLTGAFAIIALLLAATGLYSVLAYSVAQRTSEIGLRMALGAQTGNVLRLIMRQGFVLISVGLVIGLGTAAAGSSVIRTLLFEIDPLNPPIFSGVTALFAVVGLFACLIPSLRASRIDPIVALRTE